MGSGVGGGTNSDVTALTVFNSDLYAAGFFTTAGGNPASRIAKWDGTAWSAVGSTGSFFPPSSLTVYNSELYAGYYTNMIYKWNGTSWATLTAGGALPVHSMIVHNSELWVGGDNQINRYNGTSWATPIALGSGGAHVSAFAIFNGELYAAGNFATIGGVSASSIAKWNGTTWTALGTGISGVGIVKVSTMTVYNNELYIGGSFTTAGGVSTTNIAKWDGTAWSAVGAGGGLNLPVSALQVHNGNLYIGGSFNYAPPYNVQNMAIWNGTAWLPFGPGTDATVRALTEFNGQLIAGGSFVNANNSPVNNIAAFTQCTVPPPAPGPMTGKDTTCSGGNQTYSVPPIFGMSYTWTLPSSWTSAGSTSNSISAGPKSGTGTVSVSAINACGSSPIVSKTVLVYQSPMANINVTGNTLSTAPGMASYQWYLNGNLIPGATASSYTATQSGSYYVIVTSNNGCKDQSQSKAFTLVGVDDVSSSTSVRIFPNPHNGVFTIQFPSNQHNGRTTIEVRDISGKLVYQESLTASAPTVERTIDLTRLSSGVYSLRIVSDATISVHSVIRK